MPPKPNEEVLTIPSRVQVFDDPRTHAKSVALPFTFPNGTGAVLIISKLQRMAWSPEKEIASITITYLDGTKS